MDEVGRPLGAGLGAGDSVVKTEGGKEGDGGGFDVGVSVDDGEGDGLSVSVGDKVSGMG